MGLVSRLKTSPIAHLFLAVTFIMSGLIINLIQAIMYVTIRPISKYVYRKLNYYATYSFHAQLVFLAEWWSGSDVTVYIDKDDFKNYYGKEHGYLVMNHTFEVDWLIGFILCERIRILGNCKVYAKKVIQYFPIAGWNWLFGECVFLERNWDKDKETMGKQLKELMDYPDPIFLLLFAEGTRFTHAKHEASMKFAREKGLPELKHHLLPRTKGFVTSILYLRQSVPALYNVQIAFDANGVEPTVKNLLLGRKVMGHMYMKRIPMSEVPEDEEDCAKWLHALYQEKDKMQASFIKTGDFFEESGVPRVEGFIAPKRYFTLLNMLMWSVVILIPMIYTLIRFLTSGSTLYICIGLSIICLFSLGLYKMIGLTKISRGSSYGTTNTNHAEKKDK